MYDWVIDVALKHAFANGSCRSSSCLLMGKCADPCNSMGKCEDACSRNIVTHSAASSLLEVQTQHDKFNKLQDKLKKSNVATRQETQAAQHWQNACLAARARNNLLTQDNYQLKQEHQKLADPASQSPSF